MDRRHCGVHLRVISSGAKGWQFLKLSEVAAMTAKNGKSTKASEPDKVDAYMKKLKHPLTKIVATLRQIILSTDKDIGEEIKCNAPTFFNAGEMGLFDPKENKRNIVVFNLY